MANLQNAKEWLKASFDDLETMSELQDNENLTNISAFHSQQSVEKSFKALIEYNQLPLQKTHNLEKLYISIKEIIEIDNLMMLEMINELYIDSRYPGDMGLLPHGKPSINDVKEFYDFSNHIFMQVCKVLKTDKKDLLKDMTL